MAFSKTGPISFDDLRVKLGGSGPISFEDYYQNSATNYCRLIEGIPTTGNAISLDIFRGKSPTLVYNSTGGDQTLTIPSTCTMIFVKSWGAGGGGQYVAGGPGGFSSGYITVNPNEVITIKVGSRGRYSTSTVALPRSYPDGGNCTTTTYSPMGSGGGSSSIWRNAAGDASIVAGGGGGGGNAQSPFSEANTYGGAGGGTNGIDGTKCRSFEFGGWQAIDNGVGHFSGNAGTQTAGGLRGGNCSYWYYQQAFLLPTSGAKYSGGSTNQGGGGAGGGGYYGGGAGGFGDGGAAAGGGGSGYIGGCLTTGGGAPVNPVITASGNNSAPPNTTDFHYASGKAVGGAAGGAGGDGMIIIIYAN
jgi:hypothetical protein